MIHRLAIASLVLAAVALSVHAATGTQPVTSPKVSPAYAPVQKLLDSIHERQAMRKSLLPTGTGYAPPAGTLVSWHQGGSASVAFTVVLDQAVPYTGSEASYWGRYCPGHNCPGELNGPWIGQGMLGTESAGGTTSIAYDALVCHYNARPTDQELFDYTVARFIGIRYLGSPWGDGCGEQPVSTPTPTPRPSATPPMCNEHGVVVPCPTPAPTSSPAPSPVPSVTYPPPVPTSSPTPCAAGKRLTVPPGCAQVITALAGKSFPLLTWGSARQANIASCKALLDQITAGAWIHSDLSTGSTSQCLTTL